MALSARRKASQPRAMIVSGRFALLQKRNLRPFHGAGLLVRLCLGYIKSSRLWRVPNSTKYLACFFLEMIQEMTHMCRLALSSKNLCDNEQMCPLSSVSLSRTIYHHQCLCLSKEVRGEPSNVGLCPELIHVSTRLDFPKSTLRPHTYMFLRPEPQDTADMIASEHWNRFRNRTCARSRRVCCSIANPSFNPQVVTALIHASALSGRLRKRRLGIFIFI